MEVDRYDVNKLRGDTQVLVSGGSDLASGRHNNSMNSMAESRGESYPDHNRCNPIKVTEVNRLNASSQKPKEMITDSLVDDGKYVYEWGGK